jgi:hypothetical protein
MNGRRILVAAAAAAAVACTSIAAHADEESGLAVGLRVGAAAPFGNADSTTSMSAFQRAMVPVWFDVGYRFNRTFYLAAFYQYGVTFPASNGCGADPNNAVSARAGDPGLIVPGQQSTCDGRDQRFGLELHIHLLPKALVDPWIGIGLGYEVSTLDYSTGASASTTSFQASGPAADLQLGLDLRFSKRVPFGPFIDLSASQFVTENYYDANGSAQGPVTFNSTLHGWATFGLRMQFNL